MASSPGRASQLLRLIGQGLSLAFLRRPRSSPLLAGFGSFLMLALLSMLVFEIQDIGLSEPGSNFFADNLPLHALYFFCVLIAAWLGVMTIRRPALWLTFAGLILVAGIPWLALSLQLPQFMPDAEDVQISAWRVLIAFVCWAVLLRTLGFLAAEASFVRRLCASLLVAGFLLLSVSKRHDAWLWYVPEEETPAADAADPVSGAPVPSPDEKAEFAERADAALARQPAMLAAATAALRAQTPGKVDLFALGFAGDGQEGVFRNEVDYFSQLMSARFGSEGRVLSLINSPVTLDSSPMATLENLRSGLRRIADKMDTSEDVLLLFLTSHGSEDHELFVDLDPLPMQQITPTNLRAALDDAGIRWRIVVVSACYSGGFIDALHDDHTLVITAARADRASFGCGNDSHITWFGKAFLTDALNRTTDFRQAFALASHDVREWELAENYTPSVPQIDEGSLIGGKLAVFDATLKPAPAVPFSP
ncbi:MAG TPA: C13 family peptidase [Arenimonas sp.]|uniref:C13 family peptidase n=1 Tax=Arenimonas sp. TaxID=1872635 RepID=UPI002C260B34|nr:C13 family peptidase [Arenimonas sp.]HMB56125.1 C13 family peptidase [Arenimonas sp.]